MACRRPPRSPPIATFRRRRPLALVTEDNPATRLILKRLSEQRGFEVVEAVDGLEGVDAAARCAPDVIFLDMHMPRLDGLPALQQIRERDTSVPVVIVSSTTDAETTERALSLGAINMIRKPFDREEIQFVLDQIYRAIEEQADIHDVLDLVEQRTTELSFPSSRTVLSKVVAYLGRELQYGYPGYDLPLTEIKLALYEALANAFEHGNLEISFEQKSQVMQKPGGIEDLIEARLADKEMSSRRIYVSAEYEQNAAVFRVRDEGPGFDHETQMKKPLAQATALHGRGITLIRHYMDEVAWNRKGNEIRMRKCLERKVERRQDA